MDVFLTGPVSACFRPRCSAPVIACCSLPRVRSPRPAWASRAAPFGVAMTFRSWYHEAQVADVGFAGFGGAASSRRAGGVVHVEAERGDGELAGRELELHLSAQLDLQHLS